MDIGTITAYVSFPAGAATALGASWVWRRRRASAQRVKPKHPYPGTAGPVQSAPQNGHPHPQTDEDPPPW